MDNECDRDPSSEWIMSAVGGISRSRRRGRNDLRIATSAVGGISRSRRRGRSDLRIATSAVGGISQSRRRGRNELRIATSAVGRISQSRRRGRNDLRIATSAVRRDFPIPTARQERSPNRDKRGRRDFPIPTARQEQSPNRDKRGRTNLLIPTSAVDGISESQNPNEPNNYSFSIALNQNGKLSARRCLLKFAYCLRLQAREKSLQIFFVNSRATTICRSPRDFQRVLEKRHKPVRRFVKDECPFFFN